jgi:hypothetical protein
MTSCWQLGERVHSEVLALRRAEYSAQIVAALRRQLETRYGRGFGEKDLRGMMRPAARACLDARGSRGPPS